MCFLAAGDAERVDALIDGYHGRPFDRSQREALLRLIVLHRYSNLKAQIAVPGWQSAPDIATQPALVWPHHTAAIRVRGALRARRLAGAAVDLGRPGISRHEAATGPAGSWVVQRQRGHDA